MIDYKDMGRKIRKQRKALGYTQEQLAEAAGLSPAFMGHVERGTRIASLETLVALCNALKVAPGYLLAGSLENVQGFVIPETVDPVTREQVKKLLSIAVEVVNDQNVGEMETGGEDYDEP